MEVILIEDYPALGFVGDVVNVKPGFARNMLVPKGIAIIADKKNVDFIKHRQKLLEVKKAEKKKEADAFKAKIDGFTLVVKHAAGENDKLFGSVTTSEIHDALKENGFDIDRKLIRVDAPIKTLGEHEIKVKLHHDVNANIVVKVEAEHSAPAKAKEAPKAKAVEPKAEAATEETTEAAE